MSDKIINNIISVTFVVTISDKKIKTIIFGPKRRMIMKSDHQSNNKQSKNDDQFIHSILHCCIFTWIQIGQRCGLLFLIFLLEWFFLRSDHCCGFRTRFGRLFKAQIPIATECIWNSRSAITLTYGRQTRSQSFVGAE